MNSKEFIKNLKKNPSFEKTADYLQKNGRGALSTQQIASASRIVRQLDLKPQIKIAYLTNFTADILPDYVTIYCASENIRSNSYIGAYNQYFQEILNKKSTLHTFSPDLIFLALSLHQIEPEVLHSFCSMSDTEKKDAIDRIIGLIKKWTQVARENTSATLLLSNWPLPQNCQLGIADNNSTIGEMKFYYDLNTALANLARQDPLIQIVDTAKITSKIGSKNVYEPKMYYMAKILWSEIYTAALAEELLRYIYALKGMTKKCLVLDLDNTLWGGILGEDGISGVKIGQGDPISEAYLDFQYKIKSLSNRGIMLGICSKNNEGDVQEMFEGRSQMPLKLSDFSATQINWDHKHINLQRIANELNIGLDSLVFMDDNPVECDLIRQMLPQVKTVLVPKNPEEIPATLDNLIAFDKITILADDRNKTEQYKQNKQRNELKESVGDLNSYLLSLNTEIWIAPAEHKDLDRVHQLFSKTNQFNVTTKRYTSGEIEKFQNTDSHDLTVIAARDKFGDLGIIGLYLLNYGEDVLHVDSFILSCRAMGRGIETAIMNHLKERGLKTNQNSAITAQYIPTKKNIPVRTFFEGQGFSVDNETNEQKTYSLAVSDIKITHCDWINIIDRW